MEYLNGRKPFLSVVIAHLLSVAQIAAVHPKVQLCCLKHQKVVGEILAKFTSFDHASGIVISLINGTGFPE